MATNVMRSTTRRRVLYLAGATATVGLTGFATANDHDEDEDYNHSEDEEHNEGDDADTDSEFNDADVMFMQGMIPHHEQVMPC